MCSLKIDVLSCVFREMKVVTIRAFSCTAVNMISSQQSCERGCLQLLRGWFPYLNRSLPIPLLPSSYLPSLSFTSCSLLLTHVPNWGLGVTHWNMVSLSPGCPPSSLVAWSAAWDYRPAGILLVVCCLSSFLSPDFNRFTLHRQLRLKCSP